MLLKHLLLQNGDGGGLTATVVSWSGITPKDANSRIDILASNITVKGRLLPNSTTMDRTFFTKSG